MGVQESCAKSFIELTWVTESAPYDIIFPFITCEATNGINFALPEIHFHCRLGMCKEKAVLQNYKS